MSKLTLYSFPTPNGVPISIFLEELGVSYDVVKMSISDNDIGKVHNQVKSPWFLEINPNGRIPAITHNGFNVFETSAILLYLAAEFDKENKFSFHPTQNPKEYSEVLQWLFFAHGGVGPMQGQANHFVTYAKEKIPYAQTRYLNETKRLYGVLESRLSKHKYLAGDKYTIADIKTHGWVRRVHSLGIDLAEWPNLKDWTDRIEERAAVQKGLKIPEI
ncbi:Glutathione S-transferase 2 [Marasmius sp. AFHP31]|nr:Glutathione S-transferase 2 [Marasmius sp. AFHP31]